MVNFWIIIVLLAPFGGEKHFSYMFATEGGYQVFVVVQRPVIQNTLYQQGVADVLFLIFGRVPEELSVFVY